MNQNIQQAKYIYLWNLSNKVTVASIKMLVDDMAELEKGVAQEDFGKIRVCEVSEFKECGQIGKIL